MAVNDKIGGAWRPVQRMYDKVAGQWRPVKAEWVKEGGVWRKTFNGNFGVYFQEYIQNPERIVGSYTLQNTGSELVASISGYTGGESNIAAIGWTIRNLPLDSNVDIIFEVYKGDYPQNDVVISNGLSGVTNTISYSTGEASTNISWHGGWINFVLNFFCEQQYATTSWIKIKRVLINGEKVFPAD